MAKYYTWMGRLDGFLHHWDGGDCTQCEANCIIIIFRLWIIALGDHHHIVIVLELEWNADGIGYMYIQAPLFSIGSSMVLLVLENSLRDHFGGMCTIMYYRRWNIDSEKGAAKLAGVRSQMTDVWDLSKTLSIYTLW